jgi:hypothetical protein
VVAGNDLMAPSPRQAKEVVPLRDIIGHEPISQQRSDLHHQRTDTAMQTFYLVLVPLLERGSVPQRQAHAKTSGPDRPVALVRDLLPLIHSGRQALTSTS